MAFYPGRFLSCYTLITADVRLSTSDKIFQIHESTKISKSTMVSYIFRYYNPIELQQIRSTDRYYLAITSTSYYLDVHTWSFSMKPMNAVRSISTGCPARSYNATTKWKKLLLRRLLGGCFSKCARPTPTLLRTKQTHTYCRI